MDLWQQVRELWGVGKAASNRPAKVDYDGLIAEIKSSINKNRHKIGEMVFVPCNYLVQLSPKDVERFRAGGLTSPMQHALQKAIEGHIRERQYQVQGPIVVRLGEDASLEEGHVSVNVSHTSPSSPIPPAPSNDNTWKASDDTDKTVLFTQPGTSGASFEVVKGDIGQQGKRLELKSFPAILGRITRNQSPTVGITDPSSNVGREHATIEHKNGGFSIRDTSQNGTWVNGIRLKKDEKTVLLDGAEVSLANGVVVLRFRSGDQTVMQPRSKGDWLT
ncbi:hypothetical protein IAD21_03825 [Abditibacteriota bacterium]|nr:hypothetical protein IAD21_03825 [Abditibacteriota bacterium]